MPGPLDREEERRLLALAAGGDKRAIDTLIRANAGFCHMKARQFMWQYGVGSHYADLLQLANLGLLKAIQRFDPAKNVKLISYAAYWIDAYLGNYCIAHHSIVKYGTTQIERRLFFSLSKIRREMTIRGREPTNEEVAAELKIPVARLVDIDRRLRKRDMSLNVPAVGDSDMPDVISNLIDPGPSPEDTLFQAVADQTITDDVAAALQELPERDRAIVIGQILEQKTLRELGADFGVSRERARQLRDRGLDLLRDLLRRKGYGGEPDAD